MRTEFHWIHIYIFGLKSDNILRQHLQIDVLGQLRTISTWSSDRIIMKRVNNSLRQRLIHELASIILIRYGSVKLIHPLHFTTPIQFFTPTTPDCINRRALRDQTSVENGLSLSKHLYFCFKGRQNLEAASTNWCKG